MTVVSIASTLALDDHTQQLLTWLHRLLAWQLKVTRHNYGLLADDPYRGLYVSEGEVDILTGDDLGMSDELWSERQQLMVDRHTIVRDVLKSDAAQFDAPLPKLARLFDLSPFECDVLLLALAPEIDLRYERIYAYIQDDVTRKRPSIDLTLRLFCVSAEERMAVRRMFAPDAPLRRHRLIHLLEDGQRYPPLIARMIRLDDRTLAELLGQAAIDPIIEPYVTLHHPIAQQATLILPTELRARIRQIADDRSDQQVIVMQGSYGSGRRAVAEAIAATQGRALLRIKLDRLSASDLEPVEALQRIIREALLTQAAILWEGVDLVLQTEAASSWRLALLTVLDQHPGISFLPLERIWHAHRALRREVVQVVLPAPSFSEREQLWRQRLNGDAPDDRSLQALASTFRLSAGQIRDAVGMARSAARLRQETVSVADLYAACRAQSSGKLDNLAQKVRTVYTWDDIILPPDQMDVLRELCAQVRHRRIVLEVWGFDRRLALGKGVNALFAGPSGTGKTMAAEIIAADLGLELRKVDLANMVSKYIGETEKNLEQIFTAAHEANAILFFDEADAIFGKRSEVKDAHDRYANIEVGYLLQKMEEYDGVVILSTNLRKNLDNAFVRRLHVAIDFPFPEQTDRLRIWQHVFPTAAPLADDVDLPFLARQFKLAGGNIRNIALLAAYLAAAESQPIGMAHLARATKREYQKLGKLITEADFGPYLAFLKTGV